MVPSFSMAGDVFTPPKDLKGLIGKIVTFTEDWEGAEKHNVYYASITGVSKHVASMSKGIILYIPGIVYSTYDVRGLIYTIDYMSKRWELDYCVPGDIERHLLKIKILSIE